MRNRHDEEQARRGINGRDNDHRAHERDAHPRRFYDAEQDMGGAGWSGSSGRGGMKSRGHSQQTHGFGPSSYEQGAYGQWHQGYGGERSYSADRYTAGGYAGSYDRYDHSDRGLVNDRGPHWGKGPKGYKRSDERIREEVCEAIARQGHIDATDVEVRVETGTVVLSGTVAQRADKRGLEYIAEGVHGVDDVRNEIRLKREEPRSEASRTETPRGETSIQITGGPGSHRQNGRA